MNSDLRKKLEETLTVLRGMFFNHEIGVDVFHKGVVGLAMEYAEAGEISDAYQLLLIPPMDYYEQIQVKQMLEDPDYARCCAFLATRLVSNGYVESESLIQPTQKAASA